MSDPNNQDTPVAWMREEIEIGAGHRLDPYITTNSDVAVHWRASPFTAKVEPLYSSDHLDRMRERAERAEVENKRLRERYENWQLIDTPPHPATSPYALLEFFCVREAEEDADPQYWITRTWDERPDDAVYWCAINSPELRHEHIDALTKLQDTSHADACDRS